MNKPPKIDADGRLWLWKADTGYMPEPDPQAAYRREYLRGIKGKGGRKKTLQVIAQACKVPPVFPAKVLDNRKDRRAPKGQVQLELPEPVTQGPRKCRRVNRHVEGRRNEAPKIIREADEVYAAKDTLHAVQNGLCAICAKPLDPIARIESLDHVIPRSLGGRDGLGNYVLTHRKCNGDKSNDTPTGCEMIWLLMVNAKLGVMPIRY